MALLVALTGCSPGGGAGDETADVVEQAIATAPVPALGKSSLKWRKCGKPFQCATLRVPVDHRKPKGEKIKLALIRLRAPVPERRLGSLVLNPGGPGGSGVDFVRHAAIDAIPAELRARFDIVGFDPRGVGASAAVSCGAASDRLLSQDLHPASAAAVAPLLDAAQAMAGECGARNSDLLPHMSTEDVARDVDRLRAALGDRQLTYLGFSYGTMIGATYAKLFPGSVRALVLDGAVDPSLDAGDRASQQAQQLEKTLDDFLRACDREARCELGNRRGESRKRFESVLARMKSSPLPVTGSRRSLRASEMLVATASLLKDRGPGWAALDAGLRMAEAGDGSLLLAVAAGTLGQGGHEDWLAPLLAVNCLDVPAPRPSAYPELATRLASTAPHFGALMLYLSSPCAYWPVDPQRDAEPIRLNGAPPLVVVGTSGDPTTPYSWSKAMAKSLGNTTLVTRDAEEHTAFGGRNVCTDRTATRYLIELIVPPRGTHCG